MTAWGACNNNGGGADRRQPGEDEFLLRPTASDRPSGRLVGDAG